jgi:hypothetical protein
VSWGCSNHEGKGIHFLAQVNRKNRRVLPPLPRCAEAIVPQCPTAEADPKKNGAAAPTHAARWIDGTTGSIATIGRVVAWGPMRFFTCQFVMPASKKKK